MIDPQSRAMRPGQTGQDKLPAPKVPTLGVRAPSANVPNMPSPNVPRMPTGIPKMKGGGRVPDPFRKPRGKNR